jgi:hypothetical protein
VKQFWKTGAALLVLVALGLYIWKYEWGQEVDPDGPRETILAVEKDAVAGITIESEGNETIRLTRVDEAWRLSAPFDAPADGSAVDGLLGQLETLEADELVLETTEDAAQFGLEPAVRTVTVAVEGEEAPRVVQLGGTAPGGSAVYVRTGSSPRIYTVASFVASAFDKAPFDLRDRDLLHVKRGDVRTLEVSGPEGDYALARTDAGDWAFTRPLTTRAGRWSVDGLLGTLENLRFDAVAAAEAADLGAFGLDRPRRSVHLVLADGTTRTLEIGDAAGDEDEGKYHAREKGASLVAVIPGAIVADLEKGMDELRAKKLLEVATYDTEGFDVVSGGNTRTFVRSTVKDDEGFDQTQWRRTAPDGAELETTTVEDALFKMGGVEIREFIDDPSDLAAYGLDEPTARVTVRAKTESWIELGGKDEEHFARRSGDDAVLALDPVKANELLEALEGL